MKRFGLFVAVAAATLFTATAAQASRVDWSVNIGLPHGSAVVSSGHGNGWYSPRPVYRSYGHPVYQSAPYYGAPARHFAPAPYYAPAPVHVVPRAAWRHRDAAPPRWSRDRDRDRGHERRHDRGNHRYYDRGWVNHHR